MPAVPHIRQKLHVFETVLIRPIDSVKNRASSIIDYDHNFFCQHFGFVDFTFLFVLPIVTNMYCNLRLYDVNKKESYKRPRLKPHIKPTR